MQRITDEVYTFTGLMVGRAYAIKDSDGLTLIDSGLTGAGKKILAQLKAAGYAATDIKRIILTHTHFDHGGGAYAIQQASGCDLYVSESEAPVMRAEVEQPRRAGGLIPSRTFANACRVTHMLNDGDVIPEVLGGLRAIATPGHTLGHLSFWSDARKLVFVGDVILHTLGLARPLPMATIDPSLNRHSMRKIVDLQPEILCFGHGAPITEHAQERLQKLAEHRRL
jgi:glyoxylase-like metal-dependent hydrolase (beta-lactamase superfamily II)